MNKTDLATKEELKTTEEAWKLGSNLDHPAFFADFAGAYGAS